MRLRTHAGFRLFWTASTVSDFGTPITTLASAPAASRRPASRCSPARSVPSA